MEPLKTDAPKLSDMIMCGDHPSVTKTELNIKEMKLAEEKEKGKEKERKPPVSYTRLSPSSSRTDKGADLEKVARMRAASEHTLRALARQRVREPEYRTDDVRANKELVQAALGSFRWPPYLVCAWVLVLLLAHALHCLAALLQRAMPTLRQVCTYFRTWTEDSWKSEGEVNTRVYSVLLACSTATLYVLYGALWLTHALTMWAVEPMADEEEAAKVTNYVDDVISDANIGGKQ